jgi:hypothetical protein
MAELRGGGGWRQTWDRLQKCSESEQCWEIDVNLKGAFFLFVFKMPGYSLETALGNREDFCHCLTNL